MFLRAFPSDHPSNSSLSFVGIQKKKKKPKRNRLHRYKHELQLTAVALVVKRELFAPDPSQDLLGEGHADARLTTCTLDHLPDLSYLNTHQFHQHHLQFHISFSIIPSKFSPNQAINTDFLAQLLPLSSSIHCQHQLSVTSFSSCTLVWEKRFEIRTQPAACTVWRRHSRQPPDSFPPSQSSLA